MVTEREQREKEHLKRDKLSGYFLDMSKLTFATSVLAGAAPIFNSDSSANIPYVLVGIASTVVFAWIGRLILK